MLLDVTGPIDDCAAWHRVLNQKSSCYRP